MRFPKILVLVLGCLLLVACASTKYRPYEGSQVFEGTGGTKQTIKGIEIWRDGTPPRKYKVIGIIDDVRRESVFGAEASSSLANKATEAGGDAVIVLDSRSEIVGYNHSMQSNTTGTSGQMSGSSNTVRNRLTQAAVIKYID